MIPILGDDPEFMVWFIQTSMIVIETVVLDFPGDLCWIESIWQCRGHRSRIHRPGNSLAGTPPGDYRSQIYMGLLAQQAILLPF